MASVPKAHCLAGILIHLTTDHTGCVFLGNKAVPEWVYVVNWYVFGELRYRECVLKGHRMVPVAFGALLMVLALYKATGFWQLNGIHGSRLVRILITDQIVYFAL